MEGLQQRLSQLIAEAEGEWGVVVEDLERGERFEHQPQEPFIAESVIKVPIMAAVYAAANRGAFSLNDCLTLRREDLVGGSGFLFALSPGLRLTIRDLVTLMIIQSDNTATNMLIDLIGKEQIDRTMGEAGMKQSVYSRKLMIYPADIAENNRITAGDVAGLLRLISTGRFISRRACDEMISILKKQQVRNGLPSMLPSASDEQADAADWELACKSGWDTGRQHDVGVLYTKGQSIVIVALSKDVESQPALRTLGLLGKAVYNYARKACVME